MTGNLTPVSGQVLVRLPGSKIFVALTGITQVPFGTIVNATNGKVTVTTVGPHGAIQTMTFYAGEFELTQGRHGVVLAALVGGRFLVCPTARERCHMARASSTHASGKHVVRKLWAEGHGSYSTKGSYASGAVLGTSWLTEDLCDGTLIHVRDRQRGGDEPRQPPSRPRDGGTQLPGQGALTRRRRRVCRLRKTQRVYVKAVPLAAAGDAAVERDHGRRSRRRPRARRGTA